MRRIVTPRTKKFDLDIKQQAEKLTLEEQEDFYHCIAFQERDLYEFFPQLQRNALFLLAYGIFERRLNLLCEEHFKDFKPELSVKDFSGQGIHRAKTYLSKVHKVEAPFELPEWKEITNIGKLRNVIAHSSGELDSNHKEQRRYCEQREDITITGTTVELSENFVIIQRPTELARILRHKIRQPALEKQIQRLSCRDLIFPTG